MSQLDLLIAQTQRNNTYVYAFIFVLSIGLLVFLKDPSEVAKTILIASSATLGTILIMQNQFWYGRPRGAGVPDPSTTTTTTETPDATTTTTVQSSPADSAADGDRVHNP